MTAIEGLTISGEYRAEGVEEGEDQTWQIDAPGSRRAASRPMDGAVLRNAVEIVTGPSEAKRSTGRG